MRVRRSQLRFYELRDKKNSRRGFTLVELIVVLTIIAILAAVGVVSLVGYINKSRYDENSKNAVTVYQAAQNAIAAKTSNGTIDAWTKEVLADTGNQFTSGETANINDVNDSYHKTISLTFNPRASRTDGSQDQILYDLLTPYFYDMSVFSGTMSIELDISITKDTDGENICSARVITAYYSKQNTGSSGWDSKCLGDGSNSPLPQTEPFSYRSRTSFVGYFDGTEASITGPVSIPATVANADYVFELRNGETLDVTWGLFDDPDMTGKFDIRLHDEEGTASDVVIKVDESSLIYDEAHNPLSDPKISFEYIKFENGLSTWYKLTKKEGLAKVMIGETVYVFPLTITDLEAQIDDPTLQVRNGVPNNYTTYTISIDCLMDRASYDVTNNNRLVLSKRLFGNAPLNISAKLENGTMPGAILTDSYALRAADDPVYFTEIKLDNGQVRYCYDHTNVIAKEINDHCVVNTLFGDKVCNDLDGSTINGSYSGTTGGTAVITSYRHLSNIRQIGTTSADFKIASDLDWFSVYGNQYFSEVKVFYASSDNVFKYNSPVVNGTRKIVSFPAIGKLSQGQSLSSLSNVPAEGDPVIYSINRVQMRAKSFTSSDTGYALICDNYGTIYNIYTNNLNIVLVNLADGSNTDYEGTEIGSSISTSTNSGISITTCTDRRPINSDNTNDFSRPVGGLIAWNHGTVGIADEDIANGHNTIKMTNCIVMSSKYWIIYDNQNNKSPVGGIIGRNDSSLSSVNGMLMTNGSFAIVGRDMVGACIGLTRTTVAARMIVDGTSDGTSDFTLPKESRTNNRNMSCVLASKDVAGGAIGLIGKTDDVMNIPFTNTDVDAEAGKYTIDVNLPADSLVITLVGWKNESCGGAIGMSCGMSGDNVLIRVNNYGSIILNKTNENMYCGGAIGSEKNCTVNSMYVEVYNHEGSRIGYTNNNNGPSSSGGAYGKIETPGTNLNTVIRVTNEGTIVSRGGSADNGSGGAVGCISGTSSFNLDIQCDNKSTSSIIATTKNVGGAIGSNKNPFVGTIIADDAGVIKVNDNTDSANAGGVIGYNEGALNASLQSTIASGASVTATKYVGGTIGDNNKAITANIVVSVDGTVFGDTFIGGSIGYNNGAISGSFNSSVAGSVTASGNYAAGVIGYNNNTLTNTTITVTMGGTLSGANYVGGMIGDNEKSISGNFSSTINGTLTGTGNYVAGVVGYNNAAISNSPITAAIGGSLSGVNYVGGVIGYNKASVSNEVTVTVGGTISGGDHVGGAIGRNEKAISGTYTSTVTGSVTGGQYVGGLIGSKATEAITGTYTAVVEGSVSGTQYIGGAVGYNDYGITGTVTTNISGSVTATGNYAGGTMGYTTATVNASIINTVSGTISGGSYVGGTVGWNNKIIASVTSTVTGNISGTADVGGVIGHNEYNNTAASITGDINVNISGNVTGTGNNVAGVIGYNNATLTKSVTATISGNISGADKIAGLIGYNYHAVSSAMTVNLNGNVSGNTYVGGAVAYTNANMSGTITATFGTAYPVNGTACVGGVIGCIYNGTVSTIVAGGNGGTVSIASPSRNYFNSILVSGTGNNIGGIIGVIGTGSTNSTATVQNITVNNVGLCVTSSDNSYGLGGWIGSCYGTIGASNSYATYEVNTVKFVYSRGNSHGGFCGIANYKTGTTKSAIYANIHMTLSNAAVVGISEVGGVFGRMNGVDYRGEMTVSLIGNTRIGDIAGNITNGVMTTDGCFCIEAGGAVGYASHNATVTGGKIAVEFWDGSKIFAGGNSDADSMAQIGGAGVGGAFGSIGYPSSSTNDSTYNNIQAKSAKPEIGSSSYNISVLSPSSSPCICSNVSNAGGAVGMVYTGIIKYTYSTAVVYNNITSGNENPTGGLIGRLQKGFVQYCYVGGHTVGGQYVPGEYNVSGRNYVGGFVGLMGTDTYVDHCYSTASVRGLDYVGGFLGISRCDHWLQQGEVNNCYCTGRVTGNSTSTAGMFAGYVEVRNSMSNLLQSNRNKVLRFINLVNPGMRLIANVNDTTSALDNCCEYADAGGPGNGGSSKINVDGGTYTAYPYDGYLAGSGSNVRYPMRAFINNTHYGDWPIQPGNINLANYATTVEIAGESYPYNGSAVTIPDDQLTVSLNGTLTKGTDYYVDYVNNDHAGTATVRIFGTGNYTGMVTMDFTIDPANIETIEFTSTVDVPDEGFAYSGSEITPSVTVTYGDVTLTEGTDYELSYENNVNAGEEATVIVTGIGNYVGTVSRTFTIDAVELSYATITITDEGPFLYAGEAINPNIVVTVNDRELIRDTDYNVEYTNCDGPNRTGTISITAVPDSNYVTGTGAFVEFEIGAQTYTVEFYDAEGGNLISTAADVEYGSTVTAPDAPVVDGQQFVAWCSDGEAFDFDTQITRDVIIYATWQEINQDQGQEPDDQGGDDPQDQNDPGDQQDPNDQSDPGDEGTDG